MDELVATFELTDRADDLPVLFSRGMKQKAALVIALCRPFDLLLLDEPLANVDQSARGALLAILTELSRQGKATVFATHDTEALAIATSHIALRDGHVVSHGPMTQGLRRLMS